MTHRQHTYARKKTHMVAERRRETATPAAVRDDAKMKIEKQRGSAVDRAERGNPDETKVIAITDEMMALPKMEQGEDDDKKVYCVKSFDQTEDKAKVLAHHIGGRQDMIEDYNGDQLSSIDVRIEGMQKSISELVESVSQESETRRKQHSEVVTLIADNVADGVAQARRQQVARDAGPRGNPRAHH